MRCVVTSARNRSRRTIREYEIIDISPVDIADPAHSNCNLNYKNSFYIPIVFHNLSGYDAHFIIKEIATAYDGLVSSYNEGKIHFIYKTYPRYHRKRISKFRQVTIYRFDTSF